MQIKKEILLFFALVLLCVTLITAADFSRDVMDNSNKPSTSSENCCEKDFKKGSNASPWNFITQGILHFSV